MDDSRKVIGSWIEGPRAGAEQMGAEFGYRGKRLGLPEEGSGSVAGTGRRLVAVLVDWFAAMAIAYAGPAHRHLNGTGDWALFVFFVMSVVLLATTGSTLGKRLAGLRVVRLDGGRASIVQVGLRTFLLCLAVPALIWDRDTRGLHDKAVGTVEVRI